MLETHPHRSYTLSIQESTFSSRRRDTGRSRITLSLFLSFVSNGYPELRTVMDYDHLSYFLVNPAIFDVSHGAHRVERAGCSSSSWSAPFFAGRRKCARIGRSRYKRGSVRQTRGMKRAGETRASFKRPLQRSLLRAFYEESGPINQRPPSDNWIHSLEIVRTFSQRSVSCLETVSLLLYRSSIKPDNWLIEGTIVITCGYARTTFT